MSERASDIVFTLTVRDGGIIEIWRRDGITGAEFAAELRRIALAFETSVDVRRIK